jgi:hypothetical protein
MLAVALDFLHGDASSSPSASTGAMSTGQVALQAASGLRP